MREKILLALISYTAAQLNPRFLDDAETQSQEMRVLWRTETEAGVAFRTQLRAMDLFKLLVGDGRRGIKRARVFELGSSWYMSGQTTDHAWLSAHLGAPASFD